MDKLQPKISWICLQGWLSYSLGPAVYSEAQHVKMNSNKKFDPKQKTFQTFNIDPKRFRNTKNENPKTREIEVTSQHVPADLPMVGRLAGTG